MDRLWAPWRSKYMHLKKNKKCVFCIDKKAEDKKYHIIARSSHSFAMLNIYPYNNGHVMVAPLRHVKSLECLSGEELLDLMKLVNRVTSNINKKMKPHGLNIGMNIGRVSGAGFPGHLHIHIVPRWTGDVNFMPVTAGAKILSESLDAVFKLLRTK
ncbi:MAG: HIT domain-containing protein [Candidatus Omnitrophota bacterium]